MADISYDKINWENEPSHNTPLSAQNLNKMDTAIDELVEKSNSLKPNPTGTPTEGLEKLEYDGTVYEVKGGHKVLDDSGTLLQQKDNLQFKGVYSHNVGDNSEVDIVREFQSKSAIEALTGEEAKGFQYLDDDVYDAFTAGDIGFDKTGTSFNSTKVQGVLEEVDGKIDDVLNYTYVGELTTENSLNVSNYEELNLIPYVNGAIPYNPYFIKKISNTMEFYISIYQSDTHNTSRRITITNGTITQAQNTLNGWVGCTIRIYAR